jgi:hypothetical protein
LGEFDQIAPNAWRFLAGARIRARQLLIKEIRKACTLIQINPEAAPVDASFFPRLRGY